MFGHRLVTIIIAILIGLAVYGVTHSVAEAISGLVAAVVALAFLLTAFTANPHLPASFSKAQMGERQLFPWLTAEHIILAVIALAIIFAMGFLPYLTWIPAAIVALLTWSLAAIATLAFFPYVYDFYPVPSKTGYYVEVMRALWLPAEQITLKSGRIYHGYTLSITGGWFTVLLVNSRKIVYLSGANIAERVVCQPNMPNQPPSKPPLISLFYTHPPNIPGCGARDMSSTLTSVVSQGESLNVISSLVHVLPEHIISVTNAYEHQRISTALRAYEKCGHWNAPAPIGQRFWYYPSIAP
jgi:hypothetical protein